MSVGFRPDEGGGVAGLHGAGEDRVVGEQRRGMLARYGRALPFCCRDNTRKRGAKYAGIGIRQILAGSRMPHAAKARNCASDRHMSESRA